MDSYILSKRLCNLVDNCYCIQSLALRGFRLEEASEHSSLLFYYHEIFLRFYLFFLCSLVSHNIISYCFEILGLNILQLVSKVFLGHLNKYTTLFNAELEESNHRSEFLKQK